MEKKLLTNEKDVFSNLLKFISSDQSEGGGGAKPINQSFKDQVMLSIDKSFCSEDAGEFHVGLSSLHQHYSLFQYYIF